MTPRHGVVGTRGLTLVELMVTLAVMVALVTLAAPAFRDLLRRRQVEAVADTLAADLTYARHEAAQRASFVSICPSRSGESCDDETSYAEGWIVYAHPAGIAGADRAYAAQAQGFLRLRYTVPSGAIVANATDAGVVTFGQQGQLKSSAERPGVSWRICTRGADDASPRGEASSGVPGIELRLAGAGSLQRRRLGDGDGCALAQ